MLYLIAYQFGTMGSGLHSRVRQYRHREAQLAHGRHGLAGPGADPVTGQPAGAAALRARLLEHVYPAARVRRHRDDHRAGAPAR
jgi:hypothetical protein